MPNRTVLLVRNPRFRPWSATAQPAGFPAQISVQLGLQPELARLALLESHGRPTPGAEAFRRRELNLTRLNLACGILVLGLTAIARVL